MDKVRKFFRLVPEDKRLLVRAFLAAGTIRLGLWLFSFPRILAMRDRFAGARKTSPLAGRTPEGKVAHAVDVASRYIPAATCLTKALATQVLLGREGVSAQLKIGVARGSDGELMAHAWLEREGRILMGDLREDQVRYSALPAFERVRV